jgi:hypothetical protein
MMKLGASEKVKEAPSFVCGGFAKKWKPAQI